MQAKMVRSLADSWTGCPWGPPIVVHCSAGIGRTGTFIAIQISMLQLTETGKVNIRETVEKIRSQRAFSIVFQEQYVFIHEAIILYANKKN